MAKERPILFSGGMVRAILEGRKTQTRRPIKNNVSWIGGWSDDAEYSSPAWGNGVFTYKSLKSGVCGDSFQHFQDGPINFKCPYGQVGDRLWVRETFLDGYAVGGPKYFGEDGNPIGDETIDVIYRADEPNDKHICWKPSIFMPRWASRITLEITGVRVEEIQDIELNDIISEGIVPPKVDGMFAEDDFHDIARERFIDLWDSINGKKYPWESNPWVWVIEFKRI